MSIENEFESHEILETADGEAAADNEGEPIIDGALARVARPTADAAITREQRRSRRKREVRAHFVRRQHDGHDQRRCVAGSAHDERVRSPGQSGRAHPLGRRRGVVPGFHLLDGALPQQ